MFECDFVFIYFLNFILIMCAFILGIETSCDETGVALYATDKGLLAHTLHSQIDLHAHYGGVVPELASREHIQKLVPLIKKVLLETNMQLKDVDAIAYTQGPGLAGALLVGASVAHALAFALDKPIIGVHHLEGHLLSPLLSDPKPPFPFIALLVSGGHTQLMLVEEIGCYTLLGETIDDAAGEAFDKTAKLLDLGYPGGPALSKLAEKGTRGVYHLPRPMIGSGDLNFSFSGLKTAVLTLVQQEKQKQGQLTDQQKADIACAFQEAIVDVLTKKALKALKQTQCHRLVVAGGVGANAQLRAHLNCEAAKRKIMVFYPPLSLCTDNGAMIALAGSFHLEKATSAGQNFQVFPRWELNTH